jgi:Porin subfamily
VGVGLGTATITASGVAAVTSNLALAGSSVGQNAGNLYPDIVGNLRVDQAWGSAQASVVAHNDRVGYNGPYASSTQVQFPATAGWTATSGSYPSDTWGWAAQLGVTFNLPMLAKGDTFSIQGTWCKGASAYCANTSGGNTGTGGIYTLIGGGGSMRGLGFIEDAYYNAITGGSLELPTAYSIAAGINHYWLPNLQQSLYGAYFNYKANSTAVESATAVSGTNTCAAAAASAGSTSSLTGCRDWSAFMIGSRILWNPVVNLDVGVDVLYNKVKSAYSGYVASLATPGIGTTTVGDVSSWAGIVRFQRNFWP